MSQKETIYQFSINSLQGNKIDFSAFEGKVLLLVNTASKCGFTPQYEGLEKLNEKYKDKGLVIIGFPCNQFGKQEPGSAQEIQDSCLVNYGVSFA
ncbi:MAG: glutathione peroxidase, partial [Crocinitomicaceae bacterium]